MSLQKGVFDKLIGFITKDGIKAVIHEVYDYEYIVDYHPKRDGNNPLYFTDEDTQLIISFKDGNPEAIEHFANLIGQDYNPMWNDCFCIAVPASSSAKNYSPRQDLNEEKMTPLQILALCEPDNSSIYKLIERLVDKHKGLHNGSGVLIRTKTVQSKHLGRDRKNITIDLNSIEINSKCGIDISGKNVLLIDDIITSGYSIAACEMILKRGGANKVFVLCLGKTAKDSYVSNSSGNNQPVIGKDVPFDEEVPF